MQAKIFADRVPETVEFRANQFLTTIPPSQISDILRETKIDGKSLSLIYIIKVKYVTYINEL